MKMDQNGRGPRDGRATLVALAKHRGFSLSHLSRTLDRNVSYLQQFAMRATPFELELEDRLALAALLHCSVEDLTVDKQRHTRVNGRALRHNGHHAFLAKTPHLPVLGRPNTNQPGLRFTARPIVGQIETPPSLVGVSGAYACVVPDNTMAPALRRGLTVFLNPQRAPKRGDEVLLRLKDRCGRFGIYLGGKDGAVSIAQLSPEKSIFASADTVEAVHTIVLSTRTSR